MNNLQYGMVSGTLGTTLGVIVAAGSVAAGVAPLASAVPVEASERYTSSYRALEVSTSLGQVNWIAAVVVPSESDFRQLALDLAKRQIPMGAEIDRLFAANLAAFLD